MADEPPRTKRAYTERGLKPARALARLDAIEGSGKWMTLATNKRAAFVREYLIDMSPHNAAIRAGYPPSTAAEVSKTLMKLPEIRDALGRAIASRARRVGVTADRVLDHLGRMAFGNPKSVFHPDGSLKAPEEMDDDDAMMIAGVKTRRIVEINPDTGKMQNAEIQEVKLIDRTSVLSLLMRHLGMNNDKLTIDVGGTLAEQLEAAMARREGGAAEVVDENSGLTAEEMAALEHEENMEIDGIAEEVVEDDPLDGLTDEQREMI
jgi:phage terminase small subunit